MGKRKIIKAFDKNSHAWTVNRQNFLESRVKGTLKKKRRCNFSPASRADPTKGG